MRSLIIPALALLAACAFPVEDFSVRDEAGTKSDAGSDVNATSTASEDSSPGTDTAPAIDTAPSASGSGSTDSGFCICIAYDGKIPPKCNKWQPDKCGEGK